MQCRVCGKVINLRSKREHMNRLHDKCNSMFARLRHMNITEEDCIEAAAYAEKNHMEINTVLAIRHIKAHGKRDRKSNPDIISSEYKFVQTSSQSKKKPWRAEVRLSSNVWITDKHFKTEEEAVQHVIDVTGLKRECLILLKDYRLSKDERELMFLTQIGG